MGWQPASPRTHACQAARKQFPSVILAFHSPLARSHILGHAGPTLTTRPLRLSVGEVGQPSTASFPRTFMPAHTPGQAAVFGGCSPSSPWPPPPLLACFFPGPGQQGPFCF